MRSRWSLAASIALVLASCGGGDGGTATPETTAITQTTAAASTTSVVPLEVEVTATGFTTYEEYGRTNATAAAEVRNTSTEYVELGRWRAELIDANGAVVTDSSGAFGGTLAPGATTWLIPSFLFDEGAAAPTSMRVVIDEAPAVVTIAVANGPMPVDGAQVRQVSARTYVDINASLHVEAVFENPGDARLTNLYVACGLYANDVLIGGTYGFVSEILPGGRAAIDTTSGVGTITPLPSDVRCAASPVNISTYELGATGSGLEVQAGMSFDASGGQGRFYDTLIGVIVHNPTDRAAFGVRIDVDVLDADGNIVHLATPSDTYVLPGETVYTGIRSVMGLDSGPPASVVARSSVASWGDPTTASLGSQDGLDLTAFPFDISDTAAVEQLGLLMFVGTVTNRSAADLEDAVISCAALDGGEPTGGSSWTLGPTPVGEPTPFEIIAGFGGMPVHDTVRCTVHLTSITQVTPR